MTSNQISLLKALTLKYNCFTIEYNLETTIQAMVDFRKYLNFVMNILITIVGYIPSLIYSYIYSEFFTKATYRLIGERNRTDRTVNHVLDIGTATGGPLKTIVHSFENARVLGIDYNPLYIPTCKKLFEENPNVEIRHMNFYDLEKEQPETLFDVIIFGSSFMLMPDQTKALEIATRRLSKSGKIYFLLTLYEQKTLGNKIMEYVKPILKYLSTVDFGKVTYRTDFEEFLVGHELKIKFMERCYGNFFLKLAKFYIYEVVKC